MAAVAYASPIGEFQLFINRLSWSQQSLTNHTSPANPAAEAAPVEARQGDEDDGVGWFVAVPALMKPGPAINVNLPIPGLPCDDKKKKY
ncbi:hypothetical protein ACG7TL_008293 [Trametes sanguinea]